MAIFERIKKGIPEFLEQSEIVHKQYGGIRIRYLMDMIWSLFRFGARPLDYVRFEFYKKSTRERNRYLTIFRYFKLLDKFGYKSSDTYGKIAEYKTFSEFINRKWMILDSSTSVEELMDFCKQHEVVFAKPNHGDQGKGIVKFLSNDIDTIRALMTIAQNVPYVIESAVENDKLISFINPTCLNTVRAYTLIDKTGCPRILGIMLRVGKTGSYVDNWGAGGVGYNFDLDTGVCVGYGRDKKNVPYVFHPGTNVQMIGFKLPKFDELKKTIINLSKKTPKARFVGWDIAYTPNGFELIEMNCPGGHDFLQAFGTPFYDILKKNL